MAEKGYSINWEAPEHYHTENSTDWFWVVGIITVSGAVASFIFGNLLFALLILVGGFVFALVANKEPETIPFSVTMRGIRINEEFYPFSSLESYYVEEEHPIDPQLLIKTKGFLSPLLIIPIPEEYIDEIEEILAERLEEEELEEPLFQKLLEFFGF